MEENKKQTWFMKHKVLTVIMGLFVLGIITNAAGGGGSKESANWNQTQNSSQDSESSNSESQAPNVPTEYLSALDKAQSYSDNMYMSKAGIYHQLVSEYGEQFTKAAAQYAVDHVQADWNYNALQKAKSYRDTMGMSPESIHHQLTSQRGEEFTFPEADYAIEHLDK